MLCKKMVTASIVASLTLTGCASSQLDFVSSSYSIDDTGVCRNYLADRDKLDVNYIAENPDEQIYIGVLRQQVKLRGLFGSRCTTLVREADDKIAVGVLFGVLAVGAAVEGVERQEVDAALGRLLDDIEQRISEDRVMGGSPRGNA